MNDHLKVHSCNICNKIYSSKSSLWNHNNKFHNINVSKSIPNVSKSIPKTCICNFCNKQFSSPQNRWKHETKVCKSKDIIVTNKDIIIKNEDIIELQNKIKDLENKIINNKINNTNNGIINNNKNNIIVINDIGKELINSLQLKDIIRVANDGLNGPITCIKKLNFNKNLPQNHSFCSTSLEGKYFTTINHKTQKKEKISKKELIHKVLSSSLIYIEGIALQIELNNEFREKITNEDYEKIQYILNNKHKYYEKKNLLTFFNSINSMSYNYKDLISSTWNLLHPTLENDISDISSDYSETELKEINYFCDSSDED